MSAAKPDGRAELLRDFGRRPVVVVAPHPDDAALSIGGLLRMAPFNGLHVVTVFSRSCWAPLSPHHGDVDHVSFIRSEEDRRYAAAIGAERCEGGLPDSSARDLPEGAWMRPPTGDDPLLAAVSGVVAEALRRAGAGCVLCPAAIGSHVDHMLARDSTLSIAHQPVQVCLYEDVPYAALCSDQEIARHLESIAGDVHPVVIDISDVLTAKLADVELFQSQARPLELEAAVDHARRVAGSTVGAAERIWIMKGSPFAPRP